MAVKKVTIRSQLRTARLLKLQTEEWNIADFEDDKKKPVQSSRTYAGQGWKYRTCWRIVKETWS